MSAPSNPDQTSCAADRVPQRVIDAMIKEAARSTYDDGHTDCYYAGLLLVALDALLEDDEAMSRARWAYLNSPPHAITHDKPARLTHMRAAFRAALDEEGQAREQGIPLHSDGDLQSEEHRDG